MLSRDFPEDQEEQQNAALAVPLVRAELHERVQRAQKA
jgi:hypothetical protein